MSTRSEIGEVVRIIKKCLDEEYANITDAMSTTAVAKLVAGELFSVSVVSKEVKDEPTYDKIQQEFLAGMKFIKKLDKLEEHCFLFLEVLTKVQGPLRKAAETLERSWTEKVKEELQIILTINRKPTQASTHDGNFPYYMPNKRPTAHMPQNTYLLRNELQKNPQLKEELSKMAAINVLHPTDPSNPNTFSSLYTQARHAPIAGIQPSEYDYTHGTIAQSQDTNKSGWAIPNSDQNQIYHAALSDLSLMDRDLSFPLVNVNERHMSYDYGQLVCYSTPADPEMLHNSIVKPIPNCYRKISLGQIISKPEPPTADSSGEIVTIKPNFYPLSEQKHKSLEVIALKKELDDANSKNNDLERQLIAQKEEKKSIEDMKNEMVKIKETNEKRERKIQNQKRELQNKERRLKNEEENNKVSNEQKEEQLHEKEKQLQKKEKQLQEKEENLEDREKENKKKYREMMEKVQKEKKQINEDLSRQKNLELQKEKQELEKDFKKTKNQMENTWNQKIQQLNDIIEKQRQNNSRQHKCTEKQIQQLDNLLSNKQFTIIFLLGVILTLSIVIHVFIRLL